MNTLEIQNRISNFDLFYEMSDSHEVWEKWTEERKALTEAFNSLGSVQQKSIRDFAVSKVNWACDYFNNPEARRVACEFYNIFTR